MTVVTNIINDYEINIVDYRVWNSILSCISLGMTLKWKD